MVNSTEIVAKCNVQVQISRKPRGIQKIFIFLLYSARLTRYLDRHVAFWFIFRAIDHMNA